MKRIVSLCIAGTFVLNAQAWIVRLPRGSCLFSGAHRRSRRVLSNSASGTHVVLEGLTVKSLKDLLRARGLPVTGRKALLIERLQAAGHVEPSDRIGGSVLALSEPPAEPFTPPAGGFPTRKAPPASRIGSTDSLREVERVFAVVESVIEGDGPILPRAVIDSRASLLMPSVYAVALENRRASVARLFPEQSPQGERATRRIEMAHVFLSGFISHERRKMATETVRVILNEAVAGGSKLDDCFQSLASQGKLDDELFAYVDSLVAAEARKCGVQPPPLPACLAGSGDSSGDVSTVSKRAGDGKVAPTDSASLPSGANRRASSSLLQVLSIVRHRVLVERQVAGAQGAATGRGQGGATLPFVKILARAAAMTSEEARGEYLVSVLPDRPTARDFTRFCEEGAAFLTERVEKQSAVELFDPDDATDSSPDVKCLDPAHAARVKQAGSVRQVAAQARAALDGMAR